jgi:hypothetical protein
VAAGEISRGAPTTEDRDAGAETGTAVLVGLVPGDWARPWPPLVLTREGDVSNDVAVAPFVVAGSADVPVEPVAEPLGAPLVGSLRPTAVAGGAAGDIGGAVVGPLWTAPLGAPASSGVAAVPVTIKPTRTAMAARATAQMPSFNLDILRFGICTFRRTGLCPTIAGPSSTARYARQTMVEE